VKDFYILGISAYYHNSAAALIKNGSIVAAAEEERFTRIKGDASFPINAIIFCLEKASLKIEDIAKVVYYEDTTLKFGRIFLTSLVKAPCGIRQYLKAMPKWVSDKLWIQRKILMELGIKNEKLVSIPHHLKRLKP